MITISAEEILKAVDAIDMVPTRAGIVPSEFIQLEKKNKKLYFSLAAEVYGKTFAKSRQSDGDDWIFHVDRLSFVPFVKVAELFKSPADFQLNVETKKDAKRLIVKAGRRKVAFNSISFIQGYPSYGVNNAVAIPLTKRQKDLLALASKFATSDPTLAYINCVYMEKGLGILASNRISLFKGDNKEIPISVPLPILLLSLIDSKRVRSVEVAKNAVKLVLDCGNIYQAINATAKTDFPLKQISKQFVRGTDYPVQFKVKAGVFLKALLRLELYVKGVVARELFVYAKGIKGEDKLTLYCDTPQGRFTENVSMIDKAKNDFTCEWRLPFLTPLEPYADTLKTLTIRFNDSKKSPYHLVSPDGIELMLSRRV